MAMKTRAVRRSNAELLNWLRPLFPEFNRQFFGEELPAYEIRVDLLMAGKTMILLRNGKLLLVPPGSDLHGLCMAGDELKIFVESRCAMLEDECVREVLLHEMCHASVSRNAPALAKGDPHGKEFIAELRRLAAVGVAWASEEAEYYETVPLSEQAEVTLDDWRAQRAGYDDSEGARPSGISGELNPKV